MDARAGECAHAYWVVFRLNEQRYALSLNSVERIVRAAAVTPLASALDNVLGVINVAGSVIPVLDLRQRLKISARGLIPTDQFLLAHSSGRTVALVVDEVLEVIDCLESELVTSAQIGSGASDVQGVVKRDDGLISIYDLDHLLLRELDQALGSAPSPVLGHALPKAQNIQLECW